MEIAGAYQLQTYESHAPSLAPFLIIWVRFSALEETLDPKAPSTVRLATIILKHLTEFISP